MFQTSYSIHVISIKMTISQLIDTNRQTITWVIPCRVVSQPNTHPTKKTSSASTVRSDRLPPFTPLTRLRHELLNRNGKRYAWLSSVSYDKWNNPQVFDTPTCSYSCLLATCFGTARKMPWRKRLQIASRRLQAKRSLNATVTYRAISSLFNEQTKHTDDDAFPLFETGR